MLRAPGNAQPAPATLRSARRLGCVCRAVVVRALRVAVVRVARVARLTVRDAGLALREVVTRVAALVADLRAVARVLVAPALRLLLTADLRLSLPEAVAVLLELLLTARPTAGTE